MEVRVERSFRRKGFIVFAYDGNGVSNNTYIAYTPLSCEMNVGLSCPEFTVLSEKNAQILMDDLWAGGLRPTEGSGSAGSLKATENHLKDMRKISSKLLKIELED